MEKTMKKYAVRIEKNEINPHVRYDGQTVSDPEAVPVGGRISAQVAHGTLTARVEERTRDGAE